MPKYLVRAYLQVEYLVPVEAEDEESALQALDEWIDDDFKQYQTDAVWDFEVQEDEWCVRLLAARSMLSMQM